MTESTTPKPQAPKPRPVLKPSGVPQPKATLLPARDRSAELAAAASHGRADASGTVYLVHASGERIVGQYPDADQSGAVEYFARKYLDLIDQVALLEDRLAAGADAEAIKKSALKQQAGLESAQVVGDLEALSARLDAIQARAESAREAQRKAHAEAKEAGLAQRVQVVEEAEAIASADPARIQWKQSGARMNELFDAWKHLQATTPRLPKDQDQELWGRFSKARNTFDRHRREFFSKLDKRNAEGKRIKEKLVEEAQVLSSSTEWRETAAKFRQLMDKWKAAPRAGRKDDDALWAKFRAAQDVFFHARAAQNEALDAQYSENLKVKEGLLAEAQALLPISDIDTTKKKLRSIQDRWEDAGRVPRADVSRMEGGLQEVERALAQAEEEEWRRTNPEARARTSGMVDQLQEALALLEADVKKAKAAGDQERIQKAEDALATKRAWLEQIQTTAKDLL